jgi:hypothetical protein
MLWVFSASRTTLTQRKKRKKKESTFRGNGMRQCKVFGKKILSAAADGDYFIKTR